MLSTSASFFIIIIAEMLQFTSVRADGIVTIKAYCTVEELDQPRPVYKHVRDQIENCEELGYVQNTEVKAIKDGIYYAFSFESPQDLSALDIPKENKCMDYEDEEDNELENLLNNYQNANKEMTESEKEYQQKLRDSESVQLQLPLRLKALLSAYDEGRELSGSKAGGVMAQWNEYESNHQSFYDPLLEEKKPFEEKKRLCKTAKYELDVYINKMEEEKELAEYRKFYDENGKDEQLGKLLKKYLKTREAKEECIKNCIQVSSMPELAGLLDVANQALTSKKELCAIAKNALDAYIKKMEEEKEKHKHFESVRTEKRKKAEEIIQNYEEKWSHSPKRGRGKIAKEGKEKKKKI